MRLDGDEFGFVPDSYELIGGDYTRGYVRDGKYMEALSVLGRAYYFHWKYRPLNSPLIDASDKRLFEGEEREFGYRRPIDLAGGEEKSEDRYRTRLVVPDPERFYMNGAGKPLLPALLNIPALALVAVVTKGGPDLLKIQFGNSYHPVFLMLRASAILCGLLTLVLLYALARHEWGPEKAVKSGAFFLLFPSVLLYFPNIHHDAYMVPFLVGAVYGVIRGRYVLAGISLGLALASKNTALLMVPVLAAYILWTSRWEGATASHAACLVPIQVRLVRLLKLALVAFVTLLPFANPYSYAVEVLTPFTGRDFDRRGENVDQWTIASSLSSKAVSTGISSSGERFGTVRNEVRVLQRLVPWTVNLGFIIIAILACGAHAQERLMGIAFGFTLMIFPHSIIFGDALGYRSLMFAPFFAFLMSYWSTSRWGWGMLAAMSVMTAVLLVDPLTVRGDASPDPSQRWWSELGFTR